MAQPEKLSIWDRLFNRYRREIIATNTEVWNFYHIGYLGRRTKTPNSEYVRKCVEYKVIDRVTGSERIEVEYLS